MIQTLKLLIYIEALQILAFAIFYACLKGEARRLIKPLDLVFALAIPAVGLFGHYKSLFYALLLAIPLFSIGDLQRLVMRYLLILPLFPALLEPYVVGGFYFADVSAIEMFNLGALTALGLTRNGRAKSIRAMDWTAWLFFLVSIILEARGVPINGTLRSIFGTFLDIIPPFYILARSIKAPNIASNAALFFALGGFCNAIIAIFETRMSWPLYQKIYDTLHVTAFGLSATLAIRAGHLRAQGALANPATLGLLLALSLLVLLSLRSRFRPAGHKVIIALLVLGMLAAQSRGAWIAAIVGVALYYLYSRRMAILAGLAAAAVAGMAIVTLAPADSRLGQIVGRSGGAQWTADYRGNLLDRGLDEIARHPVMGQTRAQLEVAMNDMRQGEHIIDYVNTHLTVALEEGLGGFVLWLIAWCTPLIVGWGVRRRRAAHRQECRVALPFAMIGACFTCLTFTSTIDRMMSLVMVSVGLMSAFVRLARSDGARKRGVLADEKQMAIARSAFPADEAKVREPA